MKENKKLLHAALGLFVRKGFHETSVTEIASKAGMTRGAFYRHYNSKGDLFLRLLEEYGNLNRAIGLCLDNEDLGSIASAPAEGWKPEPAGAKKEVEAFILIRGGITR